jgi:hypothetical protein
MTGVIALASIFPSHLDELTCHLSAMPSALSAMSGTADNGKCTMTAVGKGGRRMETSSNRQPPGCKPGRPSNRNPFHGNNLAPMGPQRALSSFIRISQEFARFLPVSLPCQSMMRRRDTSKLGGVKRCHLATSSHSASQSRHISCASPFVLLQVEMLKSFTEQGPRVQFPPPALHIS